MWAEFVDYLLQAEGELKKGCDEGDWPAVKRVAHALKGMGSSYGESKISQLGEQLQYSAAKGESQLSTQLSGQLLSLLRQVVERKRDR